MIKRVLKNNAKIMLACFTITSLLMTSVAPVGAATIQNAKASSQSTTVSDTEKYRNVMYYGDWSIWGGQNQFYPQYIPADKLTHLNFAFMDFNADGSLNWTDIDASLNNTMGMSESEVPGGKANAGILAGFKELKNQNPNLKIGVSMGGWSMCGEFTEMAANPTARKNFAKNVCEFIKYANMDFVDIDWEYPTIQREPDKCDNKRDEGTPNGCDADRENYILLLQDIRDALDAQGKELNKKYELSVALPAPIEKLQKGIDVEKMFKIIDFANIMTYDMRGAWDPISGHQTGLYTNSNDPYKGKGLSVDESVQYLLQEGAPSQKLVVGAAYYTRGWEKVSKGDNPETPGLFGDAEQCTKDANGDVTGGANPEIPIQDGEGGRMTGVWSYNALDKLKSDSRYPGLKEYWDDEAKAPYLYSESNGGFFTYDNARSIEEKVKYVKEHNLGGMIAWMASQDKETTSGSKVRDELTKVTYKALYGDEKLPEHEQSSTKLDLDVKLETPTPTQLNKGNGVLKITINNVAKVNSTDSVVKAVEERAKTIMNAKLYLETDGIDIIGAQYPLTDNLISKEGNKYVIDVSKSDIYTNRLIEPGKSLVITLDTKQKLENTDSILGLSMEQKIYPSSTKSFGRQSLYGYDPDIIEYDSNGNAIPNISGVRKITTYVNQVFDKMSGVKATDLEDGDITDKVQVTGDVNIRVPGTYELVYSVTDSVGATRTVKCQVTVDHKKIPLADTYDPNKTYDARDPEDQKTVIYNGAYYVCKWYSVKGVTPGTNSLYWEYVKDAYEIKDDPMLIDLAAIASTYNSQKGDNVYIEECDLNSDGIIDVSDLVLVARNL